MRSIFISLLFFISSFFIVIPQINTVEAATQPDLARHIIYVRDPSGADIPGATVTVTYNGNSPSTYCNIPGGKSTETHTAYPEGNYYVVDNVCCTVSGFSVSASKFGYSSNSVSVPNPWLTGTGHSTIFVNDGGPHWGGVVTLTPNVTYTCDPPPNSTTQCQQQGTGPSNNCATNWKKDPANKTCPGSATCCVYAPPVCGDDCSSDPAKCSTISGTCNKCLPNASGSGKSCQTPACGSGCLTDADCSLAGSCSKCLPSGSGKTCQEPPAAPTATHTPVPAAPTATHTPVPATPTHTPIPTATATPSPTPDPFSPAMCKCDNMEISGIGSGLATKVTAFGKVEGADITHAKIQSMKFFLGKGPAGSTKIVLQSGELAATIVEEAATKVRYKSVWDFTMPALDRGVEHRLWTTFKCIKKIAFEPGITGSSVVLGSSTENVSIFSKIFAFFVNLGPDDRKTITTPAPTPELVAQVENATSQGQVLGEKRSKLQLETFIPGEVTKKACQTIYFKLK